MKGSSRRTGCWRWPTVTSWTTETEAFHWCTLLVNRADGYLCCSLHQIPLELWVMVCTGLHGAPQPHSTATVSETWSPNIRDNLTDALVAEHRRVFWKIKVWKSIQWPGLLTQCWIQCCRPSHSPRTVFKTNTTGAASDISGILPPGKWCRCI